MTDYTISIVVEQEAPGADAECFELTTDGLFTSAGGVARISYVDNGGDEDTETSFVVEPSKIILQRGSSIGADMVFEEQEKHHFLYQTPFGALAMGVSTDYIRRDLTDTGGSLYIKYALDVDNVVVSRNSFQISVKPAHSIS